MARKKSSPDTALVAFVSVWKPSTWGGFAIPMGGKIPPPDFFYRKRLPPKIATVANLTGLHDAHNCFLDEKATQRVNDYLYGVTAQKAEDPDILSPLAYQSFCIQPLNADLLETLSQAGQDDMGEFFPLEGRE